MFSFSLKGRLAKIFYTSFTGSPSLNAMGGFSITDSGVLFAVGFLDSPPYRGALTYP